MSTHDSMRRLPSQPRPSSSQRKRKSATRSNVATIVLDDDDDVSECSPRTTARFRGLAPLHHSNHKVKPSAHSLHSHSGRGAHVDTTNDEGKRPKISSRLGPSGVTSRATVDLTQVVDDCEDRSKASRKRKLGEPSPGPAKEVKLNCAICMDTMKEETSTVCGHIFCRKCITAALKVQKACPACRKKLGHNQIHRIYLSGST